MDWIGWKYLLNLYKFSGALFLGRVEPRRSLLDALRGLEAKYLGNYGSHHHRSHHVNEIHPAVGRVAAIQVAVSEALDEAGRMEWELGHNDSVIILVQHAHGRKHECDREESSLHFRGIEILCFLLEFFLPIS